MADIIEEIKKQGNELYKNQKFAEAVDEYSKALELSRDNPILLSNRSAAQWKLERYEDALKDAEACIQAKPDWVKGYLRKTVALNSLKKYGEAKEAAVKGFSLNDLRLSKDFVTEWLKASKSQVSQDRALLLLTKPYHNFYPNGVDLISDKYCDTLLLIVESLMPSKSQGVLGMSHTELVQCLDDVLEQLHALLSEFDQLHNIVVFSEWIEKVKIDVDSFNLLSRKELMEGVDQKSVTLASWLHKDLLPALVPVVAPILLLVPLAVLSRSVCLRCMNSSHFTLEYFAHATLALFEDSIFDEPVYISTYIQLLFLFLYSYGSVEIWTAQMLELVQVTIVKIQRLLEQMPKTTKNFDYCFSEYTANLSVFLEMKIDQISESEFSHNPSVSTDLEQILRVECCENPSKARMLAEEHLQKIHVDHPSSENNASLILNAQEMFIISSVFTKIRDIERGLAVYTEAFSKAISILKHTIENGIVKGDEISTTIGSLRHFALCGASFLIDSKPDIAYDAFIKWKCLYSEVFSILIRLGLRANNRTLFQVLSDPLIQAGKEEQLKAFSFSQTNEEVFTQKYFPHVLQALACQTHMQVKNAMEVGDVILDYIFDVFHPTFNADAKEQSNQVCYVCVLEKTACPKMFELDMLPILQKTSDKHVAFDEIEALCADLSKCIFPHGVCQILENKRFTRLCISLDSYLHDLPIEACPYWEKSETGQIIRLCEKFEIVRISSPRELLRENVIASLRFVLNPSLDLASGPSILDVDATLKAVASAKIKLGGVSFIDVANRAIELCGHTQETLRLESERLQSTASRSKYPQIELSPKLMQALQNSVQKNLQIMNDRREELKDQVSFRLNPPTFSLNTKCYIIGNPKYNLDGDGEVAQDSQVDGCTSSLASLALFFGLSSEKSNSISVDHLPETQREVETIQYIMSLNPDLNPLEPLTGVDATVGSILALECPFIVHIATHGFMKSFAHTQSWQNYWNDTTTALLLAGSETYLNGDYSKLNFHINTGCLTPATVCAVNLEGTRLVFLSACRSGVGYKPFHETAQSLYQAFRGAGALSVISTLWNVKDDKAADFASLFYTHFIQQPAVCPSRALFLARKHLIEQNEPFLVYASFTCSGLDLQLNPATATEAQNIQMVSQ